MSVAETSMASWAPYVPSAAMPWNLRRVVHLHRRAAFAAPWGVLQRDLVDGPQAAIDRLLAGQSTLATSSGFDAMARTIGDAAMASGSAGRLKAWWLYRMQLSPDPLGERLTLMWHNHFATSNRKVQSLPYMREQNDLLRAHARAPFKQLLMATVKHPAMLQWLDADSNRKGAPNENLAREMMELFTLGIGNYTESDVKEAARALTGWTVARGKFASRSTRHDTGTLNLLGQQSPLTGDELIERLINHPATARRVAWRLCHTFMGEGTVQPDALEDLAQGLRENQLNIGWAVETLLRSQRFFADGNLHTRILGPIESMMGLLRATEQTNPPPSTLLLAEWAARMGHDLFYPPNVGGWTEGRSWLGSRTIVARANFAAAFVEGRLWHPERPPQLAKLVEQHLSITNQTNSQHEPIAWLAKLLWGHAPESLVKQVAEQIASKQNETSFNSDSAAKALLLLVTHPQHPLA